MAPDEVATQMILQEHYITLYQYVASRANGFTKVADDPSNEIIYNPIDSLWDILDPSIWTGERPEIRYTKL